ncbi:unnamed protein product [Acanthoscelides obtectus]|uniref:Uncharacterized protein n=1 Tax=Acanthoscelides obtectus TaxID=200917 RepID=A0A9P0K3V6_ACAOB|nr:unnamed protein product [Acanthoscelides obtectus]CAK1643753.1 hypothetical protein AOBTE_LOCUS13661 [Acanthoscelides obtectus]
MEDFEILKNIANSLYDIPELRKHRDTSNFTLAGSIQKHKKLALRTLYKNPSNPEDAVEMAQLFRVGGIYTPSALKHEITVMVSPFSAAVMLATFLEPLAATTNPDSLKRL